jgi:2-polyprenyl-3-methyl-5-hydroxy-6-metoxy-1,4-benzoquinol methylase
MRTADRWLQLRRIHMALPHVQAGDRLLDVGCRDGAFIDRVRDRVARAVGIDPLAEPAQSIKVTILRGSVPGDPRLEAESFDCITMLATLEHVDEPAAVGCDCFRLLAPGGRLILTVPHLIVDRILSALIWFRVADGMGLGPHRSFDLRTTEPLLSHAGFRLVATQPFEFGLNRLFVFEKPVTRA